MPGSRLAARRGKEPACDAPAIAAVVLAWYDTHARKLPWRVGPPERARGIRPDPYRVWLSEIMLQQTTVAAVKPYFDDFIGRWPDVAALAAASREAVMKAWAGLGYYARARNLKACAEAVVRDHGGRFPETVAELKSLPGIGAYTAAAVAAIAFGAPAAVVDGNIERVIARLFSVDTPLPAAKPIIRRHQAALTPADRAGDYAQAMMDLGAAICTPRRPVCSRCPLADRCGAHAAGNAEAYPVKAARPNRLTRRGTAFVVARCDGAVLLRRRPDEGLLGGMAEVPGGEWSVGVGWPQDLSKAPIRAAWRPVPETVIHVFTHFRLELRILTALVPALTPAPVDHWWAAADEVADEALPSVMKKAIAAALPGAPRGRTGGKAA